MKKILIIGGTGFIGFNLANTLKENRNNIIHIADNFFRGKQDKYVDKLIANKNVKLINGDFTANESFKKLDKEYDHLYMLASMVGVNNTLEIPNEIIRVNAMLILNTLEWVKKSKIKKVLFTSTSENYAGTIDVFDYKIPTPEDVPLTIADISHPRYTYAVTKIFGESAFLNYSKIYGFEACIIRYHNVFGPRMGFKHVIPHLAERFLNGEKPFKVYGSNQTRAFCFISDAVNGTILAMENESSNGQIFHIGTMDEISIKDLVIESGKFFKYNGEYIDAKTFPGSTNRRCPDISKAAKELGYAPKVNWKKGLKITLKWYKNYFMESSSTFESSFSIPTEDV